MIDSILPPMSDELLADLRKAYRDAPAPKPNNGLRAVYDLIRGMVDEKAELCDCMADSQVDGYTPGPWDVLIQRVLGNRSEPVVLVLESQAALALAFPGANLGKIQLVKAGHLLVQRLPANQAAKLAEGETLVLDLAAGTRVVVPGVPAA